MFKQPQDSERQMTDTSADAQVIGGFNDVEQSFVGVDNNHDSPKR